HFHKPEWLDILGGRKAMIESPLIQEIVTESQQTGRRKATLDVLSARFGGVNPNVTAGLEQIKDDEKLPRLTRPPPTRPTPPQPGPGRPCSMVSTRNCPPTRLRRGESDVPASRGSDRWCLDRFPTREPCHTTRPVGDWCWGRGPVGAPLRPLPCPGRETRGKA